MKNRFFFLIIILYFCSLVLRAQLPIAVSGYVTALETGFAIQDKEVFIGMSSGIVLTTAYTNNNGFYSTEINLPPGDSLSAISVWVIDCRQQEVVQFFQTGNTNMIEANFEICTIQEGCQANFLYQPQPANPLSIAFINLSTPVSNSTYWQWDFGDGSFSYDFEPVHEYPVSGTYNVCLTMTDTAAGVVCASVSCAEVLVNNNSGDCQAMFYGAPLGLSVAFSDLSAGAPDTWFWDFGDGTSSGEQNPVHSWNIPGTFQVCLTIFNDSTQCQSTFCDFITIGDTLPDCHASYTYEQAGNNTLAFTNLSTGMIDQFIWDFGDGSLFSHEYEPIHTFQQAGIYHVCLAIISNYTGCQDVLCIDITVGDTISACQAAFSVIIDSIPGNINHYWFNDTSTGNNISNWYWDFGDGFISYLPSVEHTFSQGSTYTVCHAVGGNGPGGYCADTMYSTIITPTYYNLGGQVFAGNFPINNPDFTGEVARVRLFLKTGNHLSEVASGLFQEYGYYYFMDVLEGNYVAHAEITPESNIYNDYLPSYTGETRQWQQSQPISLSGGNIYGASIIMPPIQPLGTGPGLITGAIECYDNSTNDLSGKIVFLMNSGSITSFTHTDSTGGFVFAGLPYGTYSLTAEIAGIYSQTTSIILTEFQNQAIGTIIQVASSGIFGIEEEPAADKTEIGIYPNPAFGELTITFEADQAGLYEFRVFSATGTLQMNFSANLQRGVNVVTRNISHLCGGLYLLALENNHREPVGRIKFMKQ